MALKSAILGLYLEAGPTAHLAAHAPAHPDALPPGPEVVSPLPSCELVEATTIHHCIWACQWLYRPQKKSVPESFFLSDMGWPEG